MQLEEMRAVRATGEADPELQISLEQAKRKFDVLLEAVAAAPLVRSSYFAHKLLEEREAR